ncbi:MAG: transporter substrate-binding domain-containing protein [Colwellia sp.]|nr:transporter substrate-binding domain-containing protein [Colwellia sp.]
MTNIKIILINFKANMLIKCILSLLFFINCSVHAQQTVIINDVSWPPYFFIGENSTQQGIAKELLNICVPQAGYSIEYRRLAVKNTHIYMATGAIDITLYSYKKERDAFLIYSNEKIFSTEYGFMVKASSNIKINKLDDLIPYRIGHLAGLTYTPELMKIITEKEATKQLVVGFNLKTLFSQLLATTPRFDIMADAKTTFHWQAQVLGVSDKIKVLDYNIAHKDYFVTVSKNSPNVSSPKLFLSKLDSCLKKLKNDGQYQTILNNYGKQQ